MMIEITPMNLDDLEEIKDSLLEKFDDFWNYTMLQQELQNKQNLNSYYFVARLQNEIVGFCGITMILDEVTIMNLVVRKDKRSLGIGSYLLQYIIHFAKEQHSSFLTLEVNEKNIVAIHLYQKYHFQQVGLRKNYYHHSDNAILMTLLLS